jgi:hypothetical protein
VIQRVAILLLLLPLLLGAQFARPDGDVTGQWDLTTNADTVTCYTEVDETSVSDADYCQEDDGTTLIMSLSDVTDPVSSSGHILRVYAYRSSNKANTFTARLVQDVDCDGVGATEITTNGGVTVTNATPGQDWADSGGGAHTLTSGEADTITVYADLCLEVTATSSSPTDIFFTWAELEVPDVAGAGRSRRMF